MTRKPRRSEPFIGRERNNKAVLTVIAGGAVNLVLFFVKLYIGLASNSLAILTDAVNNLSDAFGFTIAALGFSAINKKGNATIAYGYGRVEYLAEFLIAAVVCAVGASFLYKAVERFVLPYLMTFTWSYFAVIAATAAVKIMLGVFFKAADKRIDSGVLRGASLDSFLDAGITAMTLIGFALNRYSKLRLDAVFGLIIGIIMTLGGVKLLITAAGKLLGKKISPDREREIRDICLKYDEVEEVVGISVHDYGMGNRHIIIEAVFTNDAQFAKIKNITAEISREISERYGYFTKVCVAGRQDETRS